MKNSAKSLIVVSLMCLMVTAGCTSRTTNSLNESQMVVITPYLGVWEDLDTGTRHTFVLEQGLLKVRSVVDDDGEVFQLQKQNWDGSKLSWTYLVPSTGYILVQTTQSVEGTTLVCTWSNSKDSGTQEFIKVE